MRKKISMFEYNSSSKINHLNTQKLKNKFFFKSELESGLI